MWVASKMQNKRSFKQFYYQLNIRKFSTNGLSRGQGCCFLGPQGQGRLCWVNVLPTNAKWASSA